MTPKRFGLAACAALLLIGILALPGSASASAEPAAFPAGVGADEVTPTSARLWTRTPAPAILAQWSTDPSFLSNMHSQPVPVSADHDGTAHTTVTSLTPATRYYYRFLVPRAAHSRVGTFRTAPLPGADVPVTFAFSGDQDGSLDPNTNQPCFNHFESFTDAATHHPDFYVNLGDTIYGDANCEGTTSSALDDYRRLYKQNLTYDALRNLRATTGFYSQWDDHEVQDNWNRQTVDPQLLAAGRQAFMEYQNQTFDTHGLGFYRHFRWGSNVEIFVLDERSFRTQEADAIDADGGGVPDCQNSVTGIADLAPTLAQAYRNIFAGLIGPQSGLQVPVPAQCTAALEAAGRTMLGTTQRTQFLTDLARSPATFKLIMNEDPMQQFFALPYDRWEGYRWERNQILSFIDQRNIANVVWLTTDVHAYIAHTVDYNTDTPGVGQTVQGMMDYTVGPVATNTFQDEIDSLLGEGTGDLVRLFLLSFNANTCAELGGDPGQDVGAPYYGYGLVTIQTNPARITVQPIDQTGVPIAGNGGAGGRDPACFDYSANAS
jgi:alkaline phosphatase D